MIYVKSILNFPV